MNRILATCSDRLRTGPGSQPVPTGANDQQSGGNRGRQQSGPRRFASCAEAQASGVTPLRRGTRWYVLNRELDGDGDGCACE